MADLSYTSRWWFNCVWVSECVCVRRYVAILLGAWWMADYETLHVCRVPWCQKCVKFWWWPSDPIKFKKRFKNLFCILHSKIPSNGHTSLSTALVIIIIISGGKIFLCSPGLLETLQKNNSLLDQIQKCLEAYLESKRVIFPRFYFLSNDELLEILAQTRNPLAVQPHLRKCFDAISKLEFGIQQAPSSAMDIDGAWSNKVARKYKL